MNNSFTLKSFYLSVLMLFFGINLSQAQSINPVTGEPVKYCSQHTKHAELMQNPQYAQQYAIDQEILRQQEELLANSAPTRGTIYKIPVVFHVLHNGGPENISREQILDALRIMNRDWRKQNADTANVVAEFRNLIADIEIEFVLATKAPNGACFAGITRTQNALTADGSDGGAQVDAIVAGNDVYNGQWPGNKYMNVFICQEIGGAAGYTTKPSNWSGASMTNGIWVLADYVGSIGTSSDYTSRTLTHEAGHWLNLSHTWGDTNEPGLASNCSTDDGVADTPNTRGVTSCNLNENYCGPRANVENYMDYSYCSKMFTEGQKTRMRAAIVSSVGGRNNLWTSANLAATGADGNLYLCDADFYSNKRNVCIGEEVSFMDASYNRATSWNWTFEGANITNSTEQNPTVIFTSPGVHTISLTASDGTITKTASKTAYIRVYSQSEPVPFFDGFENYTSLVNNTKWDVENLQNNQTFDINTATSFGGTKCVKLNNYNQASGSEDQLIGSPLDLSTITSATNATMSFKFSYRKKNTANSEKLQVSISKDCGTTWSIIKNLSGTTLGTIVNTNAWTPSSTSDWTSVHVTNISSAYWVENFMYKFTFISTGGNNLYLDNINIYPGPSSDTPVLLDTDNDGITNDSDPDDDGDGVDDPSDALPYDPTETVDTDGDGTGNNSDPDDDNDGVLDGDDPAPLDPTLPSSGLNEKTNTNQEFTIMPNPTDKDFVIEYNAISYDQSTIEIINPLGKIIETQIVNSNPGTNMVFMSAESYASGIYLVKMTVNNKTRFKRLIIK